MKNINKSNIEELVGKEIVNVKNNTTGVVVRELDGKYTVDVNGEEKTYSLNTVIRNWKIVDDVDTERENIEKFMREVVLTLPLGLPSSGEIETEEIIDEDKIVEETEEEVINENNEVIEEETEDIIDEENTEDENDEVIEEETEEFILETENRGIIDNIKETEGKVKITGHLYGVPVKFDKINQTTVWKTLNRLYDNRKNENDEYSLEDKKYLVRQLKQLDEKVFAGAFRCLVSKTKQNYIEELMK